MFFYLSTPGMRTKEIASSSQETCMWGTLEQLTGGSEIASGIESRLGLNLMSAFKELTPDVTPFL